MKKESKTLKYIQDKLNYSNSKHRKIVDLPTGVTTKISDRLEGNIEVCFDKMENIYNEKLI